MSKTKIEWTEKTWNPVTGCTKIAAGCKNCYAESIAKRFWKDRKFTDVQTHPERLQEPYKWKKPCMIFVNSMSDLFHEKVPEIFIHGILSVIESNPQHIFQILTKRPKRAKEIITLNKFAGLQRKAGIDMMAKQYTPYNVGFPMRNLWLGVSVSIQKDADKNIPILFDTPAAVRWVSVEPLLEEVDLSPWISPCSYYCAHTAADFSAWLESDEVQQMDEHEQTIESALFYQTYHKPEKSKLDWVVIGCESGHKRRPCKIEWVESIVEQCKSASVQVFVKQLNIKGRVTKNIDEFPKHLQIREFPKSN